MRNRIGRTLLAVAFVTSAAGRGESAPAPIPVSPGSTTAVSTVDTACPTFSWGSAGDARTYELVVYSVDGSLSDVRPAPVLEVALPGSALSWTPSLERCLQPGDDHAWSVRAVHDGGSTEWSEPFLFRVAAAPSAVEVEEALAVLRAYLDSREGRAGGASEVVEQGTTAGAAEGPAVVPKRPPRVGEPPWLLTTPDAVGIGSDVPATSSVTFGVHGISNSADDDSAGVVGQSTAASGDTAGVIGQTSSAAGAAGIFDNTAGGDILRGLDDGTQVFEVDGAGQVTAAGFTGDGSGLTGVTADDADTLDGIDSPAFLLEAETDTEAELESLLTDVGNVLTDAENAASASALAADGADCPAGQFARGVDATGNAQGCTVDAAGINHGFGTGSTRVGEDALVSSTTGTQNSALGYQALTSLTTGFKNTVVGAGAMSASLDGYQNTAVGVDALRDNLDGSGNVAIGHAPLARNTSGEYNVAIGSGALYRNTSGIDNIALARGALVLNTTGRGNIALGSSALAYNETGDYNIAIGEFALNYNSSGEDNIAIGEGAMSGGSSGERNVALGTRTLVSTTTDGNTAAGSYAASFTSTGSGVTAVGYRALQGNTTGSRSIALGYKAGYSATTGDDNIFIGNEGVAGDAATIKIGTGGTHTTTFVAGIRGVTTGVADAVAVLVDSAGQLGTVSSSRRFKKEIREMGAVSSALMELRPVTFRYKEEPATGEQPIRFGLIAEEVAEVLPDLVVFDERGRPETVKYHLLSSLLLNEVQKLRRRVAALERRRSGPGSNEPLADGLGDRPAARSDVQLVVDVADVRRHRVIADP